MELKPQIGPQTDFLATPADLGFYGGGAGGGKTYALLFEALRHIGNPRFNAVFLRRTKTDLTKPGGLVDTSNEIYPLVGGKYADFEWSFPSGAKITLDGMEHEKDRLKWQGSQIALIGFDEVTHFTSNQFWYMLSRNRSASGIPGYVRCGCNPDPDSFVRRLIDWWIDQDGYPIKERCGKLRWFIRRGLELEWADSKAELIQKFGPDQEPKSLTFIRSLIYDNKILLEKDPGYLANMKALSLVDRAQLLDGNWNVRAAAGLCFKREWFQVEDETPKNGTTARAWDRASSLDGDYTVGLRMRMDSSKICHVEDIVRLRGTPLDVENAILNTASQDGFETTIVLEKDPGQAGEADTSNLVRKLAGYRVHCEKVVKDKWTRAKPASAYAQNGNVKIMRARWNEPFLIELDNFQPDMKGGNDDQIDAFSAAFNYLNQRKPLLFA